MARNKTVDVAGLGDALTLLIKDYGDDVTAGTNEAIKEAGKTGVKLLKQRARAAGIGGRKYVNSFRSKETSYNSGHIEVSLYSTKYQLTHLLERSHTQVNWGRRTGRSSTAYAHWESTEKDLNEQVVKAIQEAAKK